MRVFISYATKDGLAYAKNARVVFKNVGYKVWLWEHDRTPGALTWREISNSIIVDSDLVIFFCTPSTLTSYGQALETEYALNNRVKNLAISLDNSEVPPALTARNYETWDSTRFAEKCNNLANRLPQILDSIHELEQLPVTKQESSPIANRLRSLSELNERTAGVDPSVSKRPKRRY